MPAFQPAARKAILSCQFLMSWEPQRCCVKSRWQVAGGMSGRGSALFVPPVIRCRADSAQGGERLLPINFRKLSGNDPHAFFDGDGLIDGHIGELIDDPTGPRDFQRFYCLSPSQAEGNARVVRGHVASASLGLPVLDESFRGKFQCGATAIRSEEHTSE